MGLAYVPAIISLSQYFKEKRPVAMGIASSGVGVGSFIFPIVIEYMQVGENLIKVVWGTKNVSKTCRGIYRHPCNTKVTSIEISVFITQLSENHHSCRFMRQTKRTLWQN